MVLLFNFNLLEMVIVLKPIGTSDNKKIICNDSSSTKKKKYCWFRYIKISATAG